MADTATERLTLQQAVDLVSKDLIGVRHMRDGSYVTMPMLYPSNDPVQVRVSPEIGSYRVSDQGLAFREIERFGAQRSFPKSARSIVEGSDVQVDRRTVFAIVQPQELHAAILEVAAASHQIAHQIIVKAAEDHAEDVAEALQERLVRVFGVERVHTDTEIVGLSSTKWEVSAVAELGDHRAVFQAVGGAAVSIYRTTTVFHDLALLEPPPTLIAVVPSKKFLEPRHHHLLSQAGRVIEVGDADDVYRRAAA